MLRQFLPTQMQYRCVGTIDRASLERAFPSQALADKARGLSYWDAYGRHYVDAEVAWETDERGEIRNLKFLDGRRPDSVERIHEVLATRVHHLTGSSFRRLVADRDITTEPPTVTLSLDSSGRGASNIVRRLLNTANEAFSRDLIQCDLLDALNAVFVPDGRFTEVQVKEHDERNASDARNHWEIYLGEAAKGLVPLSKSGSGLKTVLLVLLNLLVVPELEQDTAKKGRSRFVFAFEELENNLHPALPETALSVPGELCPEGTSNHLPHDACEHGAGFLRYDRACSDHPGFP